MHDEAPPPSDDDAPPEIRRKRPKLRVAESTDTDWRALLYRDDHGRPAAGAANAAIILAHDPAWAGLIEYEERTGRVMLMSAPPIPAGLDAGVYPREVIDADLVRVAAWMERAHAVSPGAQSLSAAIDTVARTRSRDPVRTYLEDLTWDGLDRLDTWLHVYLGAKTSAYASAVGRCWLISAVARTFAPGCQADHMLVLEGTQGKGKTTALRVLASVPWHLEGIPGLGTKDAADALRGPWIVEIAELDALARAEVETVKAFVSKTHDRYRESYGRRTHDHPRRIVFAGTTNDNAYLRDATGGRRFWPVACGAIDTAALERDRGQLWAEAVALHRAGKPWHLDAADALEARAEQEARYQADAWEGEIAGYLESEDATTVREVATECLSMDVAKLDRGAQIRIAKALTRLGWTTTGMLTQRVISGKTQRVKVYVRPAGTSSLALDFGG